MATCAAILIACGGDADRANRSAEQIVEAARLGGEQGVRSAVVEISLEVEAEGSSDPASLQPFKLHLAGPFEDRGPDAVPAFDFELSVEGGGQAFDGGFTSTGENGYLTVSGTPYEIGAERFKQVRESIGKLAKRERGASEDGLALLGIDVREWLTELSKEGREEVGEEQTERVSGALEVGKVLNDLASLPARAQELGLPQAEGARSLSPADRKRIERAVQRIGFDLFVGADDDVVRRFDAEFVAARPSGAGPSVPKRTTIRFSLVLEKVNEGQEIEAPERPRPLADLASSPLGQALGGTLGGAGGGGGAEPEGRGGGQGGTRRDTSRYVECIQSAKGAKELRDCERLLE